MKANVNSSIKSQLANNQGNDNPVFFPIDCPIAQSYVDEVLKGYPEFGERFAAEFVHTTTNWGYH
jgi:hypothetical protein